MSRGVNNAIKIRETPTFEGQQKMSNDKQGRLHWMTKKYIIITLIMLKFQVRLQLNSLSMLLLSMQVWGKKSKRKEGKKKN